MGLQTRSEHTAMSEINVTPLVDVMLVLLVIFIVTAPLLTQAVPIDLPRTAPTRSVSEPRNINLSINRQGEVFLDRRPVALAVLEDALAAQNAQDAGINLMLQADTNVQYGRVAQVMAAAQRAGITRLAFVTIPE